MRFVYDPEASDRLRISVYTCAEHPPGRVSITHSLAAFGEVDEEPRPGPVLVGTAIDIDSLPDGAFTPPDDGDSMLQQMDLADAVALLER